MVTQWPSCPNCPRTATSITPRCGAAARGFQWRTWAMWSSKWTPRTPSHSCGSSCRRWMWYRGETPPVFWYLSTDSQSGWGWKGPRLCLVPLPKLCLLRMRQTCCRKPLRVSSPLQSRHAASPVYSRICWMFFGFTPHESVRTPNGSMPHPAKPEERPRALLPKHEQQNQTGKEQ